MVGGEGIGKVEEGSRWVFAAKAAYEPCIGLSCFRHCVVAGIEVLAFLQLVLKQVFLVREFAVETEELLFFFRQFLRICHTSVLVLRGVV